MNIKRTKALNEMTENEIKMNKKTKIIQIKAINKTKTTLGCTDSYSFYVYFAD